MSSASLGIPQSLNLYAYVENNPVDFIDPTGLFLIDLSGGGPSECQYVEIIRYSEGRPYVADRGWICTSKAGPGGGGGFDPGRGGGGAVTPPAQKNPCSIRARGGDPSATKVNSINKLSPENKKNFYWGGGRTLGATEINSNSINYKGGWQTNVEIVAEVSGDNGNWKFTQSMISVGVINGKQINQTKDDDSPGDHVIDKSNPGKMFFTDQPGINKDPGVNTNGKLTQYATTTISSADGQSNCTVNWEVSIEVKDNKIVSSSFRAYMPTYNGARIDGK